MLAACKEIAMEPPHPGENSSHLLVFPFFLLDAATINSLPPPPLREGGGGGGEARRPCESHHRTARKKSSLEMKSRSTIWTGVILNTPIGKIKHNIIFILFCVSIWKCMEVAEGSGE